MGRNCLTYKGLLKFYLTYFFLKEWSVKYNRTVPKEEAEENAIIILSAQIAVEICGLLFFHVLHCIFKNILDRWKLLRY